MQAHLNGGRLGDFQLLRPETVATMHAKLFAHDPRVAAMAHGFYEIWRNGSRFIGHGGDTIAFHSQLVLDPETRFGFFLSFNSPDGARARNAIVNGVIDYFYATQPPRWHFDPLDGAAERTAQVAGIYRLNRRSYTRLEGITAMFTDVQIGALEPGRILVPVPNLGGQFGEIEPFVFQKLGGDARLVFQTDPDGQVSHMLIASTPVVVGDRIPAWQAGSYHQAVIALALLASLFVIINTLRNRRRELYGAARAGRALLTLASVSNLIAVIGIGTIAARSDFNRILFDFPPPGTGLMLIFPIISLVLTVAALACLVPVWRTPECGLWARVRYTYVCMVFVLFVGVLYFWHLIGWNY